MAGLVLAAVACGCGDDVAADTDGGSGSSSGTTSETSTSSTSGSTTATSTASGTTSATGTDSSGSTSMASTGAESDTDGTSSSSGGDGSSSGGSESGSSSTGAAEILCDDGTPAPGEFCYEAVLIYIPSAEGRGVEVLDVDGDDDLDIVTGSLVVRAEADDYVVTSPLPGGTYIAAGLLDDDAMADVVGLDSDEVPIYEVDAAGQASLSVSLPFGGSVAYAAKVGQLLGGPELDIAVVGLNGSSVSLYVNTPEGPSLFTALAPVSHGGSGARHVEIGDLDDDGVSDLIVAHDGAGLSILLGTGATYTAPQQIATSGLYTTISLSDVNGDDVLDIVGASPSGQFAEIQYGDGDGGIASAQIVPLPVGPRAVGIGDFDNDGRADLVAVSYIPDDDEAPQLAIRFGEGEQGFSEPQVQAFGTWADDIAIADMNDDGVDDVVVFGQDIGILLSTP
ncbi:MAG: VCBS repeat-containing protein [Myxococcota bacterium]